MGQEDRFRKQIDQLAKVLAAMLAKLTGASPVNATETLAAVDQKLKDELSLDLAGLASLPNDELADILINRYQLNNNHLSQLADIIYLAAKQQTGSAESKKLSQKALILYQHLVHTSKNYSLEWHNRIAELS